MKKEQICGCCYTLDKELLEVGNDLFTYSVSGVQSASATVSDADGLSLPFMEVAAEVEGRTRRYCVWEKLPVIWMPEYQEKELITLEGEHWTVRSVKLEAFTDVNDTLTGEHFVSLFEGKLAKEQTGEIFYLEDWESGKALVIVCEMADYHTASLSIKNHVVQVSNAANGLALGFCKVGECEALGRAYYRHACRRKELVTMSNTWGDRHGFSRVCQDFVLREIDAGEKIGVDIVQIDDGWQRGSTADRSRRDKEGRREFLGDFWDLAEERFPDGMKYVAEYAREKGIRVGLWFAPDSHDDFALLARDKGILRRAYQEWGFRFFKLDMFWVKTRREQEQFLELLREIYSWGDDVAVQMDVTRDARMNYLCGRQYGTIFVENRYTGSGNSFPHRILRNLWMIGQYLPTSKFQFELLNPDLCRECYRETDPFAPTLYDMDYLFASVMLSNPLFWMEMQFLSEERRQQLKDIMQVWKAHRRELAEADVMPVGERPSGRSFTGFYVSKDGEPAYVLLFREVTAGSTGVYEIPLPGCEAKLSAEAFPAMQESEIPADCGPAACESEASADSCPAACGLEISADSCPGACGLEASADSCPAAYEFEILASNTQAGIGLAEGKLRVDFAKPRSYVFARVCRKPAK